MKIIPNCWHTQNLFFDGSNKQAWNIPSCSKNVQEIYKEKVSGQYIKLQLRPNCRPYNAERDWLKSNCLDAYFASLDLSQNKVVTAA